ncbi:hypothetical protein LXA20_17610, partial [Erwinia amylovora]|uniref:hypothetical protein n=1 Tax=Erwinia amylovora TaxID=552 RepID=UPI0020BF0168
IGETGGLTYRQGDTVEVTVDAVHMDERTIDIALISSSPKPRGQGKTEREPEKAKKSRSRPRAPRKGAN